MVYSLRTDSWKILRYRGRYPEDRYHSVLVNNRLHWKWNGRKIPSFDPHDEQCREVSLPPCDSRDLESIRLGVLDDCLCATISISPSNYRDWVVFLLNSKLKSTREIDDLPMSYNSEVIRCTESSAPLTGNCCVLEEKKARKKRKRKGSQRQEESQGA